MADQTFLAAGLVVVALLLGAAYLYLTMRVAAKPAAPAPAAPAPAAPVAAAATEPEHAPRARTDRTGLGRLNRHGNAARAAMPAEPAPPPLPVPAGRDDDDGIDDDGDDDGAPHRLGAKKAEKMRAKEEARRQRELVQAQREDNKRREALRDEERKRRKDEEQRAEKLAAEEEAKRLAEIARHEEDEYQRLRADIVVEQAGVEQKSASEVEDLLGRIAEYVRAYKVVTLEELASEFRIRTQDAVRWLKELDGSGRITGVLDDRGKYIFISREEMEQVAAFVQRRGRVSRSELAAMSNTLIDLKGHRRRVQAEGVFDNLPEEAPIASG